MMIEFITVWFLIVTENQDTNHAVSYTIPYATQNICIKQADKINIDNWKGTYAKCKFGQLPIYNGIKR